MFGDDPSQNATRALFLSILTAVCAALLGAAADAPSGIRLLLLVVGAAIPPLVLHIGPWQGARTVAAVVLTAVALFVAYGGLAIFAFASHRPSALPLPPSLPDPNDGNTTPTTTTTPTHGPDIEALPDTIHCDISACDHSVTITSTGDEVLKIATIEFEPDTGEFTQDGQCERRDLATDDKCVVVVRFFPAGAVGTHYARMLIHQNLPGNPTYVALEGEVEQPTTARLEFDLDLVGSVPFADQYRLDLSIDGVNYADGFCGYDGLSTRCVARKLYTSERQSVRVGAKVSWFITWIGSSTRTIAQESSTLAQPTTIAVRCVYASSQGSTPSCTRTR